MMKFRKFQLLSLLMLGSITLSSCYLDLGIIQIGKKDDDSSSSGNTEKGNYKTVDEAVIKQYYANISNQSGTALLSSLKSIINTSSVDCDYDWGRFKYADEDPMNEKHVILIYARTSVNKTSTVNSKGIGWNREHTFPQSKLGNEQAKDDNHIVFASDAVVNGDRSNLKLGYVSSGNAVADSYNNKTTCKVTSTLFDPNNEARGIVARSTMYAAAMYGFNPTDNFESLATMLKWHLAYPVTKFDQSRNNKVHEKQHNRNPFVDHPEYACKIWGSTNSATRSACGL